jgi:hypothetical protein
VGTPALKDVVDRIVQMAKLSATDLVALTGTTEGHLLAAFPIAELPGTIDPDRYLRSCAYPVDRERGFQRIVNTR